MQASQIQQLLGAFAAGFSIQQLLEILDPIASRFFTTPTSKKTALGIISILLGWFIAHFGFIHIFAVLNGSTTHEFPGWLDTFLSAVFISAGTAGFNSLLKFANYSKESAKATAASQKSKLSPQELSSVN